MSQNYLGLSDELEQRFGENLDEGPFMADKAHVEALDEQYDRMDVSEFLGGEYDLDMEKDGQVYVDEGTEEAAYFQTFQDLGSQVHMELRFDGDLNQVEKQLEDYFVR